jgi:hypothetical protein
MKNLFVGTMVALGVGLLLWYFLKSSKEGQNEQGDGCIRVNRQKFTVPWIEDKIPGGTLGRISKSIFGSDDPKYGNIVSGFFKAIDVYPSDGAGKYYKNQIEAYYHSPIGLPRWQVVQGELACD